MGKTGAKTNRKVVVIGGGTGAFTALNGLKRSFQNLTAVITMSDEGGSTGVLREEFGILPPGDIRMALIALSPVDQRQLSELFNYRFQEGGLAGHAFGNLMIAALERITGSFESAVEEAGKILSVQGKVLPATLKPTHLFALMENGKIIKGESNLHAVHPGGWNAVKKVWLEPKVPINPKAKKAILSADCVVIAPGDLYTSVISNLMVGGMVDALRKTKGTVIYFVNTTTRHGETIGFKASDFVKTLERYAGKDILDYVVMNKTKPNAARLKAHFQQNSEFVEIDLENFGPKPIPIIMDLIRTTGLVRHDPEKIAKAVHMLA